MQLTQQQQPGFLNDLVAQLWPNITTAAAQIAKDVVDPILASTLPGPLSSIHFVKLDLGQVPFTFANIDVHKTTKEGIKLDVDIIWEGQCDIELDGNHVPKIVSWQGRNMQKSILIYDSRVSRRFI